MSRPYDAERWDHLFGAIGLIAFGAASWVIGTRLFGLDGTQMVAVWIAGPLLVAAVVMMFLACVDFVWQLITGRPLL